MPMKDLDGLSKSSRKPRVIKMGSKTREISAVDQVERLSQDAATQQGPQVSRPVRSSANLARAGVCFAQAAVSFAQSAVKHSGEGEMQAEEIGVQSQISCGRKRRQKGSGVDTTLHQLGHTSGKEGELVSNDQETLSRRAHPGPVKGKEMTSKLKAISKDVKTGGAKGEGSKSKVNPQKSRQLGRAANCAQSKGKPFREGVTMKASDHGLSKSRAIPTFSRFETSSADQVERPSHNGDGKQGHRKLKRPCRAGKLSEAPMRSSAEEEMPLRASDGQPKTRGKPNYLGRGSDSKKTSDQVEKPCQPKSKGKPNYLGRGSDSKKTSDQVEKPCQDHGNAQPGPKQFKRPCRASRLAQAAVKSSREREEPMTASDGFSKSSATPNFIGRGSETKEPSTETQTERASQEAGRKHSGEGITQINSSCRLPKSSGGPDSIGRGSKTKETPTADQVERPNQNVETLERSDIHRGLKQKTTAGLLGPGPLAPTLAYTHNNPMKRIAEPGDVQNSNAKKRSTGRDDDESREFFAPYAKVESKGPIVHFDQYLEYCNGYREKYLVYVRLHKVLESDKQHFEGLSRYATIAKAAEDTKKLETIYETVVKECKLYYERFEGMKKTFFILHDDLKLIKRFCKDYEDSVARSRQ